MKQTEGRIWGTSGIMTKKKSDALAKIEAFSSQVQIVIKEVSKGLETRYSELGDLQYAGFPLQKGNKSVLSDVTFTLHISYPRQIKFVDEQGEERVLNNVEAEVNAALWAWETFGGLGARTRRGFGAIRCTSNVDEAANVFASNVISAKELRVELFNQLRVHLAGGDWPKDVPHLSENLSCYRVTRIERSKNEAWKKLIGDLKKFRQQRPEKDVWNQEKGRNVKAYGRSHWSEADAIRQLTKQWLKPGGKYPKHPGHVPKANNSGKFPRAVFGLPIVFHFKDNNPEGNSFYSDDDPRDVVLTLESHDRLASPLILRPLYISEGQYVGLAVLLEGGLEPQDFCCNDTNLVLIEKDDGNAPYIAEDLEAELAVLAKGTEADSITEFSSGKPLFGKETDPLIAFLNRIQKEDVPQ